MRSAGQSVAVSLGSIAHAAGLLEWRGGRTRPARPRLGPDGGGGPGDPSTLRLGLLVALLAVTLAAHPGAQGGAGQVPRLTGPHGHSQLDSRMDEPGPLVPANCRAGDELLGRCAQPQTERGMPGAHSRRRGTMTLGPSVPRSLVTAKSAPPLMNRDRRRRVRRVRIG